jgi:hypothetical protein
VIARDLKWGVHVVRMDKTRNKYKIFVAHLMTKVGLNLERRCGDVNYVI